MCTHTQTKANHALPPPPPPHHHHQLTVARDAVAALLEVPLDGGVVPAQRLDVPQRDEAALHPAVGALRSLAAVPAQARGERRHQGLKGLLHEAARAVLRVHVPLPHQLGVPCIYGYGEMGV